MKILQLCHKPPMPAADGGCIAMNNITQGLIEAGHKVKIITIFTHKHNFFPENMSKEYLDSTEIEGVYVDTRLNIVDAYSSIMTSDSYHVNRFFSTDFDIKLTRVLKQENFDIVHLESLFMTPYIGTIRRLSRAKIVLRSHNLEFVIWEKIAKGTSNIFRKLYISYLSKKLRNYELKLLNEVAGVATISEEDKKRFLGLGILKPISTIPFGIDLEDYHSQINEQPELALFHLGAMDWSPNLEGIQWFLKEVWPRVLSARPNLKLYLAGRSMPEDFVTGRWKNVEVVGEVEDSKKFISSKAVMIVPLLSAGGIRVKIIEGLALGKAIISSSIGAEGIDCVNGEQLLIADTANEWVKTIDRIFDEKDLIKQLGIRGKRHSEKFNIVNTTEELVKFYKQLKKI
jgi:glycosyltransferase involved in cell wall biosynthesis